MLILLLAISALENTGKHNREVYLEGISKDVKDIAKGSARQDI